MVKSIPNTQKPTILDFVFWVIAMLAIAQMLVIVVCKYRIDGFTSCDIPTKYYHLVFVVSAIYNFIYAIITGFVLKRRFLPRLFIPNFFVYSRLNDKNSFSANPKRSAYFFIICNVLIIIIYIHEFTVFNDALGRFLR